MNAESIIQTLTIASIVALVADHIVIRTKIGQFITAQDIQKDIQALEGRIDSKMTDLGAELRKIAVDLAFLRGRSGDN